MFRWYVVNTYSGHENKVKHNLEHRVVSLGQQRAVRQVVVPTESVSEMKDNQKITVEKRTMPGYVLVNMELNEDSWGVVKGTPGVTGFVGASQRAGAADPGRGRPAAAQARSPRPPRTRAQFAIGESVKVDLRPALGLLRRDLRDQRGRRQAQGAGINLRSRDAGRGRLRPGEEASSSGPLRLPRVRWPKKVLTTIKLPGRRPSQRQPGAAGRSRAGPARHQHHGVLQGVQRADAERNGDDHPGRDHRLRGSLVHVHHQDAAGRGADQAGDRHRQGLGRAATATKVGTITQAQLREIAERKLTDLNANDVDAAAKIIAGTARSMGVEVGS